MLRIAIMALLLTVGVVALAVLVFDDIDALTASPLALHHILILAVLLGAYVVAPPNLRVVGKSILIWGGIGLVAIIGYTYRAELGVVAARVQTELMPGEARQVGGVVEIARRGDGHFHVFANVGSTRAPFLIDSGASMVVLTHETAVLAGLKMDDLQYLQPVSTANGTTTVAATELARLTIGDITITNVRAAVAQPGRLNANLLGLSFLDRLSRWGVESNRFVMEE